MPEVRPTNESEKNLEATQRFFELASEASTSIKAAMYSLREKAQGREMPLSEMRRDVRHAVVAHHALVECLRPRAKYWFDDPKNEWTDAVTDNYEKAVRHADVIQLDPEVKRLNQHLGFDDLGTPLEPLLLDRYTEWLTEPRTTHGEGTRPINYADEILWHISGVANGLAPIFEEPLG